MDKIFILKDSRVIGSGKHEDLIENNEEYKSLYKNQLK